MSDSDFRNYIYVSDNKLEQYLGQMDAATLTKVSTETKFKTPVLEHTVKAELEGRHNNRFADLQRVVAEVERRGLVGDLLDYKPWFRHRVDVKAILRGKKVFYVGQIYNSDILPIHYAFQCSLSNHIGVDEHQAELDKATSVNMESTVRVNRINLTVLSVTSSNWMFASDLSAASSAVDSAEEELLPQRLSTPDHFATFFKSEEDYLLYQANKPLPGDLYALEKYGSNNWRVKQLMNGLFGGFRTGLLHAPPINVAQSLRNLFGNRELKRMLGAELVRAKVTALKKLHNLAVVTRRMKTDAESEVLNGIMKVSSGDADTNVEVMGIRLLDGYYRRDGYSRAHRVILGSPLYLA